MRKCIECGRIQKRIMGRGRCSGCYKRMLRQGIPNNYKSPFTLNAGAFEKGNIPPNLGTKLSKERKEWLSITNDGANHPRYKHGREITWHKKARRIMEGIVGRKLKHSETVHHIDGDKTNNHPDNLRVFKNHEEHMRYHWAAQKANDSEGRLKKSSKFLKTLKGRL